ncbi:hypothetical protein BCR43DRAFT_482978 [Syncephalastrum racemosum]|uniref:Uncharacterized protein n=1 Tax=Syncephalastrum racemosum TaxID=13706 RepID=A0A1X2HUI3_SYNRA|nr:hypothetical protein BCR43DRAFT_482978 [Syncephalastrum racemosum]
MTPSIKQSPCRMKFIRLVLVLILFFACPLAFRKLIYLKSVEYSHKLIGQLSYRSRFKQLYGESCYASGQWNSIVL